MNQKNIIDHLKNRLNANKRRGDYLQTKPTKHNTPTSYLTSTDPWDRLPHLFLYNNDTTPVITDQNMLSKFPKPILTAYKKGRENIKMKKLFKLSSIDWKLQHKEKWFGSTFQFTPPSN